jgi:hypothetical protein
MPLRLTGAYGTPAVAERKTIEAGRSGQREPNVGNALDALCVETTRSRPGHSWSTSSRV